MNEEKVKIRSVKLKDLSSMQTISLSYLQENRELTLTDKVYFLLEIATYPLYILKGHVFVLEINSKVKGFICISLFGQRIGHLFVSADCRRIGFGSSLLMHAEAKIFERSKKIDLICQIRMVEYYHKRGYRLTKYVSMTKQIR